MPHALLSRRGFLAGAGAGAAFATGAEAQTIPLALFDAHLHYHQSAVEKYSLEDVLAIFAKAGVKGILATSTPNDGTRLLFEKVRDRIAIVPFIRPYRTRDDIQTWWRDPASVALVRAEMERGYYRGIGEFHLSGADNAASPQVREIVALAVANDFWLHGHSDDAAIAGLHRHDERARVIWAQTGFGTETGVVEAFLRRYPKLMCELSYRSGITEGGRLSPEWRRLFETFPDRFLLGSDTWILERWFNYQTIMDGYRPWLAELPPRLARRIAWDNAATLWLGNRG